MTEGMSAIVAVARMESAHQRQTALRLVLLTLTAVRLNAARSDTVHQAHSVEYVSHQLSVLVGNHKEMFATKELSARAGNVSLQMKHLCSLTTACCTSSRE